MGSWFVCVDQSIIFITISVAQPAAASLLRAFQILLIEAAPIKIRVDQHAAFLRRHYLNWFTIKRDTDKTSQSSQTDGRNGPVFISFSSDVGYFWVRCRSSTVDDFMTLHCLCWASNYQKRKWTSTIEVQSIIILSDAFDRLCVVGSPLSWYSKIRIIKIQNNFTGLAVLR